MLRLDALGGLCFVLALPWWNLSYAQVTPGTTFVPIAAGSFMMGSDAGEKNAQPIHRVVITKPFDLQDTEVTQAEWNAVMEKNPSHFRGSNKPVDSVSWHEVQEFIRRLNLRNDGYTYRLPTEAEWEYAARAGAGPDGSEDPGAVGYHMGNSNLQSHPVRSLPPNAWGSLRHARQRLGMGQ